MKKNDSWYSMTAANDTGEIYIYDVIADAKYFDDDPVITAKSFIADLKALGKVKNIELRINSPGGSVFAAYAILSALKRSKAKIHVTIDGIAASAASVIAMAGPVTMPANAMIMIHNPVTYARGDGDTMRKAAEALDRIRDGIVSVYQSKTKMEAELLTAMMADETWMTAAEAKEMGFADEVTAAVEIAARFDMSGYRNPPAALATNLAPVIGATEQGDTVMNLQELKEKHPGLVEEIRNEATANMIAKDAAEAAQNTAAQEARADLLALVGSVLPEASAKKINDIVASGVTAAQVQALGVKVEVDADAKAAILAQLAATGQQPLGAVPAPEAPKTFDDAVDTYRKANNCSRAAAVRAVARDNPELHQAYIDGQPRQ